MILHTESAANVLVKEVEELIEIGWRHASEVLDLDRSRFSETRLADCFAWLDGRSDGIEPEEGVEGYAAVIVGGALDLKRRVEHGVPFGWFLPQFGKVCALMHGMRCTLAERKRSLSTNARNAADARHAENREIAERIQAWYAENRHLYRSMDQAAEAVVKLEPVAWRTARKHIGAAAKNLPPARKA
ncbi:hypothetical protein [Thauera sp. WB-2]|uniref:hypothetical protein n=1 Tax=Thauera sp. WB-2 TaxID=2897772 RepID=UPI0022DCF6F1|nr:hypothetical protein [Thauera sp. WB-2]WBL65008.1 hypothetical protein LQF09_04070 [Thauera sp. WB-2]